MLFRSEVQVWCEAEAAQKLSAAGIAGLARHKLAVYPALAIWTTPPGPVELQTALKQAVPEVVYLFAVDPETADQHAFLKRLAGLVLYALNHRDGQADLTILAAATAQSEITVRKGLDWLAAHGDIIIVSEEKGSLKFAPGNKVKTNKMERTGEILKILLAETAAYRAYFHEADKALLIDLSKCLPGS